MMRRSFYISFSHTLKNPRNIGLFSPNSTKNLLPHHGRLSRNGKHMPWIFPTTPNVMLPLRLLSTFSGPNPPSLSNEAIFDVTIENFQEKVINSKVPVIVDCYADWCQPCKQLTPLLERGTDAARGRVVLAKIDVDKQPQLAKTLGVRSLPSVFCVYQGKMVDHFTGMPPQGQLQAFFRKALEASPQQAEEEKPKTPEEMVSSSLKMIKDGHTEEVEEFLKNTYNVLNEKDASPSKQPLLKAKCLAGLALCSALKGEKEGAKKMIESVRRSFGSQLSADAEISSTVSQVDLMLTEPDEELDQLESTIEANPDDHEAREKLALKCLSKDLYQDAVDHALEIVKRDKDWKDGAGKSLAIKIFDAIGPDHEVTKLGRKRLASILFV